MIVNADVAEADLPRIALNQPANVTVTATGDQLAGTVSAIAPSASTASGTSVVSYAVTIDLPNVPDTVRPGMSAQVSVTTAAANNVLAIPAIALNGAAGNYTVRLLGADGAVEVRPVQVGLVTSSLAEIQSGLAEGDTVITGTAASLNQTSGGNGFPGGGGTFQGGGTRFGSGGSGPTVGNQSMSSAIVELENVGRVYSNGRLEVAAPERRQRQGRAG
jgi:macrolide-specific efflux system membrane fusion protein